MEDEGETEKAKTGSQRQAITVFSEIRQATRRFDYFMVGAAGAICAYVGQNLHPQKLSYWPFKIESVSFLLLIASCYIGLLRIQTKIKSLKLEAEALSWSERLGAMQECLNNDPSIQQVHNSLS